MTSEDAEGENEPTKPDSCRLEGLECRFCVQRSGANLADICTSLSVEAARGAFLKIYRDPACLGMARSFALAYRHALTRSAKIEATSGDSSERWSTFEQAEPKDSPLPLVA